MKDVKLLIEGIQVSIPRPLLKHKADAVALIREFAESKRKLRRYYCNDKYGCLDLGYRLRLLTKNNGETFKLMSHEDYNKIIAT